MFISALAKAADCHVETVRYYEKIGLLSKPLRNANGYRNYQNAHLIQLKFIRRLKHLGFSQADIREMMILLNSKSNPCDQVKEITTKHLKKIDHKINEYKNIMHTLEKMLQNCNSGRYDYCPTLADFSKVD